MYRADQNYFGKAAYRAFNSISVQLCMRELMERKHSKENCVRKVNYNDDATLCAFEENDQYFALGEFSLGHSQRTLTSQPGEH